MTIQKEKKIKRLLHAKPISIKSYFRNNFIKLSPPKKYREKNHFKYKSQGELIYNVTEGYCSEDDRVFIYQYTHRNLGIKKKELYYYYEYNEIDSSLAMLYPTSFYGTKDNANVLSSFSHSGFCYWFDVLHYIEYQYYNLIRDYDTHRVISYEKLNEIMLKFGAKRTSYENLLRDCYHSDYEKHNVIFNKIIDRFVNNPRYSFLKDSTSIPIDCERVVYYLPPEVIGLSKEQSFENSKKQLLDHRLRQYNDLKKSLDAGEYKWHWSFKRTLDLSRPMYNTIALYPFILCGFYKGHCINTYGYDSYFFSTPFSKILDQMHKEIEKNKYEMEI
ncbi:MAG: hypothetical protein LBV55_00380 [Acholeplasmatales bacterium]|jgi:hypothetical protein|nr:hypothetical protein [Acholeplasmatales bacterium]